MSRTKQVINLDQEPSAWLMGQARSARSLRAHTLPMQGWGRTGGATMLGCAHAAKHLVGDGSPGAPREARLGAFLRDARGSGRCGSSDWRGITTPGMRPAGLGSKRHLAALLRRTLPRNDSTVRASSTEMTPTPRPSAVREAKGNGVEGIRGARRAEFFCSLLCGWLCFAKNRTRTGQRTETQ